MPPFKLKSGRVIRGLQRAALIMAVKMADEGRQQRLVEMPNYGGKNMQFGFSFILAKAAAAARERESMKTLKILLACMHAHASPYHQPALWRAPSPPLFSSKVLSTSGVQQISDPLGCDGFSVPRFTSNLTCLRACLSLVFTQDCFFFLQEIPDRLWH